jgi:lysozyme family protein
MTEEAYKASQPLTEAQIQQYQNPYIQSVVDPTLKALQQQQGVDRQTQAAQAIRSGAFGGERAGLQRAVTTGQQELAQSQAISPLYADAYKNALATAQQQQQQRVATGLQAGQQTAGIGTGAQQAGLQGGQAVIGAGTLKQQTQQAQDTAKYQQFLQERGYDFQTAQFLANIAEGTGALSGSTTTSTQPTSFFSDERLKHDIKKIGKTNDGQPIYSFKYNGDDRTQIGLLAQEVEKKHPEAVGLSGGYKTVDYAKATAGARHARAMGGLVPESMGGAVFEPGNFARGGYVGGGLVTDPNDIAAILAQQKQSFGPFAQGGLYGGSAQQDPHGAAPGYVPKATLAVPKLVTSSFQPKAQQSELQTAMQGIGAAGQTAETLGKGWDAGKRGLLGAPATDKTAASSGLLGAGGKYDLDKGWFGDDVPKAYGGGIVPRHHFASGGPEDSMQDDFTTPGLVKEDKADGKENRANVPASGFPTDVLSSGQSAKELAVAKNPSTSGGQSGMSSLAQGIGAANNALKAGKSISTMLGGGADAIGGGGTFAAGMGPFMSEAGIGAGAAEGAGLMGGIGSALGSIGEGIASVLPFIFLKDGGSVPHRAAGGLVPRQGYQEGGPPESNVVSVPDFNKAVSRTFEFEGGLNPADTNGTPSLYGINQAAHPEFFKNPSKEAAANIYKTQYWDAIGADKLDPRLAHVAYDTAVISGPGKAQEFIKQSGGDPEKLLQLRRQFQDNLIAQDPGKYGKYEKAWNNRLSTLAGDINASAPNQPQAGPQPQAAGVKPWYDKMAPTDVRGQERTMGDFLTSKDFVIPLLSGLGTMASSPSRYLGSAILQGLGGAASAYQGVQKQQAGVQETQAGTEAVLANISKGAAVYGPSGQLTGYRVYINGKVTQVPATEFMRALRAGTPYQTAPDVGGMGSGPPAPAPTTEKKATETGGLAGAAPPSNGALPEPTAPAAPAPTPYRALTPEDQRLVEKNADGVTTSNPSAIGKDAKAYEEAASGASNSMINRPRSLSYAKSLSELPAKGPISSNVFSAEVTTPFIEYVNGLVHSIPGGGDINIAKPEDLANAETIRKISGLQANAQATQAGQHSWSALQSALATTPTQRNTPMGAANLMSDILMQEQLPIDYYSHLDIMKNYAQQKGLVTGEDQAKMLGTGTFKNFMDRYSQQQMQEKESLKQIFLTPLEYKDASGQPVKTSLMSYMISHGGQVPEALRPEIEKRYGTEIYRYFNTAGKAR